MTETIKIIDLTDGEELEKEKFEVKDISGASWVLRKLSALKKKDNEIKLLADEELERINSWRDRELKANEGSREYLEGLLTKFYSEQLEVDEKFKISTPYGRVSTRKQQPAIEYRDEEVIAWLERNDNVELIRIKKEIDKVALKSKMTISGDCMIDENGTVVDGVVVLQREPKIVISVD